MVEEFFVERQQSSSTGAGRQQRMPLLRRSGGLGDELARHGSRPSWTLTVNDGLTPDDLTAGTTSRVWWRCDANPDHVWQTKVVSRMRGQTGCPQCYLYPRSAQEVRLAHELAELFDIDPYDDGRIEGWPYPADIVLRSERVVVEFGGS